MFLISIIVLFALGRGLVGLFRARRGIGYEIILACVAGLILCGGLAVVAITQGWPTREVLLVGLIFSLALRWLVFRREGTTAPAGDPNVPSMPEAAPLTQALLEAMIFALLVLLPAMAREWIRVRSDAWYHAAITHEIALHGLPPEDPYFAGLPLQYMWFYHCVLVGLRSLWVPDPFIAMTLINAIALVGLGVAIADLSLALGRNEAEARRAAWVAPLGMGALFWLLLPLRALRALVGENRGGEALATLFRLSPLDISTTRQFLSDFGSHPFFLNKFLVGTAYGLALTLFVLLFAAVVRYLHESRRGDLFAAAFWLLGLFLLHPLVGVIAVIAGAAAVTGLCLLGRARGGIGVARVVPIGVAFSGAGLLALPYLLTIRGARSSAQVAPIGFDLWISIALISSAAFGLIFGLPVLRRLWGEKNPGTRFFCLVVAAIWGMAFFTRLPGPNTADKFGFLTYLPLGIAAGWWTSRHLVGARGWIALILLLGPANLIGWAGYWGDRDRRTQSADDRALHTWLADSTSTQAVVIDLRERVDIPVLAQRRVYYGSTIYASQWGYDADEIRRRRRLSELPVAGGAPIDTAQWRAASIDLGAPVLLVIRAEDLPDSAAADWFADHPDLFSRAFSSGGISVYSAPPSR
ncbi:MAG: hypothetical protein IT349_18410 [Candidatus Eisenbacteria bacterium]|nr:hypothetical protein [Candidatus Eisenbacteria bacterium]